MSEKKIVKKNAEREELVLFLDAYERLTGQPLILIQPNEHPDFICSRMDGTLVGVELTRGEGDVKVMESIQRDSGEPDFRSSALDQVYSSIAEKERLRMSDWYLPESSILVVQMFFHRAKDISGFLSLDLQADFDEYGFLEIWLADYTTVEPFGGVELVGLKPRKWWGYHPRRDFRGKPYG